MKILDIPTTLTNFPPEQRWIQDMATAILIEVLGAIAENERMKIRARQREVMAADKHGEMRPVAAIRKPGVSRSHYYRLCERV